MTTINMPALPPEHHHDSDHVYFTADQMLGYGKACVAAEREEHAALLEEIEEVLESAQYF